MATLDTNASIAARSAFAVLQRLGALFASAPADTQYTHSRCAFIQNRIARNPNAFSSNLDVQAIMLHYPGQF